MKHKLFYIMGFLPILAFGQQSQKADTIITKDPSNLNVEYWIIHNLQGNIKSQGKMFNGQKTGLWREYNDNGVMTKAEEFNNGQLDGASLTFTWNGVSADETFKNGNREGTQMTYTNNHISSIENYHGGILNGTKKLFYEDGKIKEEGIWKDGNREGKTVWHYQNGNPSIEYTYINGDMDGPATTYYENGRTASEGSYVKNDENGTWKYYDLDGNLVRTIIYDKGKVVKETTAKAKAKK